MTEKTKLPPVKVQRLAHLLHDTLCQQDEVDQHYPYWPIPWKKPYENEWDGRIPWVKLAEKLLKIADASTISRIVRAIGDPNSIY
jgi:hypothetical protein